MKFFNLGKGKKDVIGVDKDFSLERMQKIYPKAKEITGAEYTDSLCAEELEAAVIEWMNNPRSNP